MHRALTYFGSIFNGIIMITLDVGTWYDLFGLNCSKGRNLQVPLRCFSCFGPFWVRGITGGSMRAFWKKFWNFQFPNKFRHFVWRVAKDILPTKTNLVQQHVIVDDLCEECELSIESLFHLSMECPKAREIWGLTQFYHLLSSMNFQNFMDFLWYIVMVAKWSNEDVALVVTIV